MARIALILWLGLVPLWSVCAPTPPCRQLVTEVALWGIALDSSLKITPGRPINRPYHQGLPDKWRVRSYLDATFEISSDNIATVAEQLAIEHTFSVLHDGLNLNLQNGHTQIPLVPFLPKRVQQRLNLTGRNDCYHAALHFHEAVNGNLNVDAEFDNKYITLTRGDTLRYGDLILFRGYPDATGRSPLFHAAVYLGGDLVYHKLNPLPMMPHDFTTIESLYRLYSDPEMGAMQEVTSAGDNNSFRYGQPFVMQFLRYRRN